MKKILNTLLLTLAIIGLASCSDNGEGEYTFTSSIRIVSQNVSDMSVKASEGTIVVDAASSIEATASSDWFTTSVSGKTITVKTTDNLGIEYRSGKVVIKSGSDVAEVAVIQVLSFLLMQRSSTLTTQRLNLRFHTPATLISSARLPKTGLHARLRTASSR